MAIAVVDSTGRLALLEKLDNTQYGSIDLATMKAMAAINYRRPSKALQDALAAGGVGLRVLNLPGISVYEGGYPLSVEGKLVGAVGVSGVLPPQDDAARRSSRTGWSRSDEVAVGPGLPIQQSRALCARRSRPCAGLCGRDFLSAFPRSAQPSPAPAARPTEEPFKLSWDGTLAVLCGRTCDDITCDNKVEIGGGQI